MTDQNSWATACEIKIACSIFHINITTFVEESRFNEALQQNEKTYHNDSYKADVQSDRTVFLLLQHSHFKLLLRDFSTNTDSLSSSKLMKDNNYNAERINGGKDNKTQETYRPMGTSISEDPASMQPRNAEQQLSSTRKKNQKINLNH